MNPIQTTIYKNNSSHNTRGGWQWQYYWRLASVVVIILVQAKHNKRAYASMSHSVFICAVLHRKPDVWVFTKLCYTVQIITSCLYLSLICSLTNNSFIVLLLLTPPCPYLRQGKISLDEIRAHRASPGPPSLWQFILILATGNHNRGAAHWIIAGAVRVCRYMDVQAPNALITGGVTSVASGHRGTFKADLRGNTVLSLFHLENPVCLLMFDSVVTSNSGIPELESKKSWFS